MKIEIRKKCKICGAENPKRFRTFCSKRCRIKDTNQRNKEKIREYQRKRQDKKNSIPSSGKIKCAICGRYYIQLGSHIVARHGMTAREYREEYNLPLKRGSVPMWYRKKKGDKAKENNTYKNLEKGKKFYYKKNDPRAKESKGWKGKVGRRGFIYEELVND